MPKCAIFLCLILLFGAACREKPAGTLFKLYGNKVTFRLIGGIYKDTTLPIFESDVNTDTPLFYFYFLNKDTSVFMTVAAYKVDYPVKLSLNRIIERSKVEGINYFFDSTLETVNGITSAVVKSSGVNERNGRSYFEYSQTLEDSIICRMDFLTGKLDSLTFWNKCDSIRGSLFVNLGLP